MADSVMVGMSLTSNLLLSDLNIGDIVSVYTDVEGQCKRGLAVSFTGRKLFVGEGIAMQSRHEIFGKSAKNGCVYLSECVWECVSIVSDLQWPGCSND